MDKFRIERQESTFVDECQNKLIYHHKGKTSFAIHASDEKAMKAMIILLNVTFHGCLDYQEDFSDYYANGEVAIYCVNNEDVDYFKECYKTEKRWLTK